MAYSSLRFRSELGTIDDDEFVFEPARTPEPAAPAPRAGCRTEMTPTAANG